MTSTVEKASLGLALPREQLAAAATAVAAMLPLPNKVT